MWKIHFTSKEKETNKVLDGDSTKVDYEPTTEQAEQECKDIVQYFNDTLRPGEKAREFVKVDSIQFFEEPKKVEPLDEWDNEEYDL